MTRLIGALIAVWVLVAGAAAQAADPVTLFKVVTVKDETIVGVTADEMTAYGAGAPAEVVAKALDARRYLGAWQYATSRAQDGTMKEMPVRRIVVFAAHVVRIEPHRAANEIVPPAR